MKSFALLALAIPTYNAMAIPAPNSVTMTSGGVQLANTLNKRSHGRSWFGGGFGGYGGGFGGGFGGWGW
jgi:hypothetical protein